jgi:outer membrane protein assembly factor BamB
MRHLVACLMISGIVVCAGRSAADSWDQFRGPNAAGWAEGDPKLPTHIGPDRHVIWKVPLPPGHSSPVIHGERIYLTAVRGRTLLTLGLDRKTGAILWEAEVAHQGLEKIHGIGSHAQPTTVTDGDRVISVFGSSGLHCYDPAGKLLWERRMGPFKSEFGASSSPILVGDRLILIQDYDQDSCLLALDKRTGKTLWRTDRAEFPVSCSSPIVWEAAGKKQIVVVGTLRVAGYDVETGKEVWTVRGLARISNMTPVIGQDGTLYVTAWAAGADEGDRITAPPFDEMIARHDSNKNGTLESNELPEGPLKQRFALIDRDKDGHITRTEYEDMRRIFATSQNRMVAIKPGGIGDITASHVVWELKKQIPFVPSPLYHKGYLYFVKNGGIVTSLDAKAGKPVKQERIPAVADYYSSPVGGDGKIYFVNQKGDLTVISAEPQWRVLAKARFGEDVFATPAIVDGRIYLRTVGHLYCFGLQGSQER